MRFNNYHNAPPVEVMAELRRMADSFADNGFVCEIRTCGRARIKSVTNDKGGK